MTWLYIPVTQPLWLQFERVYRAALRVALDSLSLSRIKITLLWAQYKSLAL